MSMITFNKTDIEIAAENSSMGVDSLHLKEVKIIYPEGVEQFSIPDDAEILLTFESRE